MYTSYEFHNLISYLRPYIPKGEYKNTRSPDYETSVDILSYTIAIVLQFPHNPRLF